MKILLDECVDRRFAREFPDYEVHTVPQMGWAGVKNGSLMNLAEAKFDVFVTVDRNLSFQQYLPKYNISVIVLRSLSNRYQDLAPFASKVIGQFASLKRGTVAMLELNDGPI